MAKVFPGGSSVTRIFPPSLTGGGGGGSPPPESWYVEYEFDFTTMGTATIAHNTVIELGTRNADSEGVDWKAEEDQSGDTDDEIGELEWVSGSGLKVKPKGGTDLWNGWLGFDVPCLTVALSDCIPNLTNRDVICIQVHTSEPHTPDSATVEGYGLGLYNGSPADLLNVQKWLVYRQYSAGSDRRYQISGQPQSASTRTIGSGIAGEVPRSFECVFYPSGGIGICASSTSTDPTMSPFARTDNRALVVAGGVVLGTNGSFTEPTWGLDVEHLRLALLSFSVNGDGNFYNYFTSVRILRLAGASSGAVPE